VGFLTTGGCIAAAAIVAAVVVRERNGTPSPDES
jgi:hypothetical protein